MAEQEVNTATNAQSIVDEIKDTVKKGTRSLNKSGDVTFNE